MAWQQSMQESVRVGPLTGHPASAQVFTLLPAASPRPRTYKEGNEWLQQGEGSLAVSAQSGILQTWAPVLPWLPGWRCWEEGSFLEKAVPASSMILAVDLSV